MRSSVLIASRGNDEAAARIRALLRSGAMIGMVPLFFYVRALHDREDGG